MKRRILYLSNISHKILFYLHSCRMEEFNSIVPRQPYRPEDTPSEVRLEFEAVLLDGATNNPTKNQLWIHARIKACVNGADCVPVRSLIKIL